MSLRESGHLSFQFSSMSAAIFQVSFVPECSSGKTKLFDLMADLSWNKESITSSVLWIYMEEVCWILPAQKPNFCPLVILWTTTKSGNISMLSSLVSNTLSWSAPKSAWFQGTTVSREVCKLQLLRFHIAQKLAADACLFYRQMVLNLSKGGSNYSILMCWYDADAS